MARHDIVCVTREYSDSLSALVIPHSSSLIIRSRQNPWINWMESHTPNIIQMPLENELALLIIPHTNSEVITS